MYHVDRRIHRHQKLRKRAGWLLVAIFIALAVYGILHLRVTPKQNVYNSPPSSRSYQPGTLAKVTINKPELTLELPSGWTEESIPQSRTSPRYSMHSPPAEARQLQIYIDNPPQSFGLNRAIAVSASGNGIVHDSVSDNCTTFTDVSKRDPVTGFATAKWQGIDFYCDVANYARAVVGTVSKDGFNYFNATGPTFGTHKVFITYTDNNISPDYTVFYDILDSLHFK